LEDGDAVESNKTSTQGRKKKTQKISDMHKKENMKGANTRSTENRSYPIYGYIRSCNIIYIVAVAVALHFSVVVVVCFSRRVAAITGAATTRPLQSIRLEMFPSPFPLY
jgi:hypothetical protein